MNARYRIDAPLGKGGMGAVYAAHDTTLDRPVAVKRLLEIDPALLERFRREAELMARVDHPGVARFLDLVLQGPGAPYLVLERIDGRSLHEVRRARPLSTAEVVRLLLEITEAVAAAHAVGVLHRDLKPSNVMVRSDGRAVVLDFGLARSLGPDRQSLTHTGELLGTAAYMAPEQAQGRPEPASDQYALGGVLYFCLAGQDPFQGTALAILSRAAMEPPTPPRELAPDVDPELERIALRCLAKTPAERFPDLDALLEALREREAALTAAPASGRGPWLAGAALVVLLLGLAGAAVALREPPPPSPPTPSAPATPSTPGRVDLEPLRRRLAGLRGSWSVAEARLSRDMIDGLVRDTADAAARDPRAETWLLAARAALAAGRFDAAIAASSRAAPATDALRLRAQAHLNQAVVQHVHAARHSPESLTASLKAAVQDLAALREARPLTPLEQAWEALALGQRSAGRALQEQEPTQEVLWARCLALQFRDDPATLDALNALLARFPSHPLGRALQLLRRMRAGQVPDDAELDWFQPYGPGYSWLVSLRAEQLIFLRQKVAAQRTLERLRALDPDDARHRLLTARLQVLTGDSEAAFRTAQALLAQADDHEVRSLLGHLHEERGDPDTALQHLRRATQLRPDWKHHWDQLASTLKRLGRFRDAIAAFLKVPNPKPPQVWLEIGILHGQLQEHPQAEAAFNEITKHARDLPKSLAEALFYNRAFARAMQAQTLRTTDPEAARGKFTAAEADYSKLIRINPNIARAYENRARIRLFLGKQRAAGLDMEQYLRLEKPTNADEIRGQIRKLLGRASKH